MSFYLQSTNRRHDMRISQDLSQTFTALPAQGTGYVYSIVLGLLA
jgi:hypothetical protein